jgi:hypothetical protein
MLFFAVMARPLEYVRPDLFEKAVDRHHRSYVSGVIGRSPGNYVSGPPHVDADTPAVDFELHNSFLLFIV